MTPLQERQPALDHNSLDTLAQRWARLFWQDIERHHPGIDTLNLPPDVAVAWRQRLRIKTTFTTTTTAAGGMAQADAPRLTCRHSPSDPARRLLHRRRADSDPVGDQEGIGEGVGRRPSNRETPRLSLWNK